MLFLCYTFSWPRKKFYGDIILLDRFYRMHWPFSWDSPRLHFHCRSPSTATKVIGSTHCSRSVFQCLFCVCVSFSAVDGHVYDGVRRSTKNVSYFLFVIFLQLTATLRNIADVSGTRRYFLALGLVSELCRLMKLSKFDPDLMLNISRIFRCVHVCMCTCVCVYMWVCVCVCAFVFMYVQFITYWFYCHLRDVGVVFA